MRCNLLLWPHFKLVKTTCRRICCLYTLTLERSLAFYTQFKVAFQNSVQLVQEECLPIATHVNICPSVTFFSRGVRRPAQSDGCRSSGEETEDRRVRITGKAERGESHYVHIKTVPK